MSTVGTPLPENHHTDDDGTACSRANTSGHSVRTLMPYTHRAGRHQWSQPHRNNLLLLLSSAVAIRTLIRDSIRDSMHSSRGPDDTIHESAKFQAMHSRFFSSVTMQGQQPTLFALDLQTTLEQGNTASRAG